MIVRKGRGEGGAEGKVWIAEGRGERREGWERLTFAESKGHHENQ